MLFGLIACGIAIAATAVYVGVKIKKKKEAKRKKAEEETKTKLGETISKMTDTSRNQYTIGGLEESIKNRNTRKRTPIYC